MTDLEIKEYLNANNWAVNSHEAMMKIKNYQNKI